VNSDVFRLFWQRRDSPYEVVADIDASEEVVGERKPAAAMRAVDEKELSCSDRSISSSLVLA
jgi:hypothetical protein